MKTDQYITKVDYNKGSISGFVLLDNDQSEKEVVLKINNSVVSKCSVISKNEFKFENINFKNAFSLELFIEGDEESKIYRQNHNTILLARQRTGTNVLRRFLNSHESFFAINEIFDPGIYNNKNFDAYSDMYRMVAEKNSDLIGAFFPFHCDLVSSIKKPVSYKQAFNKFLDYINLHSSAKHNIIDLKYNHMHNLTDYITPLLNSKKDIFEIVKLKKLSVINLIRKNYLKSYISGQMASKSGNYVLNKNSQKNEHKEIMIELDMAQLLYSMRIMKQEDEFIAENLKDYNRYLQIEYTEMFDSSGNFDIHFVNKVCQFFQVNNSFNRTPSLKKLQDRTLQEIIVNYDEVANGLVDTEFEYCLE